jgi:hypothetical protein
MADELEMVWKEAVVSNLCIILACLEGLRRTLKNSNRAPSEYEIWSINTKPTRSLICMVYLCYVNVQGNFREIIKGLRCEFLYSFVTPILEVYTSIKLNRKKNYN